METPDFARLGHPPLASADLNFLFSHFPGQLDVPRAMAEISEFFNTLDSLLDARFVYDALCDAETLDLPVTPQLWFEVMLRQALPGRRSRQEHQALHYLAHLLGLFVRAERLRRIQDGEAADFDYLVDLVAEEQAAGPDRRFLVQAHIANYALFVGGVWADWVEHRHRYARRPVTVGYFCDMGASRYLSVSRHPRAQEFGLHTVFRELAERFDYYRGGLEALAARHLFSQPARLQFA